MLTIAENTIANVKCHKEVTLAQLCSNKFASIIIIIIIILIDIMK